MCLLAPPFMKNCSFSETGQERSCLLLVASGTVKGISDSLAGVAETLLGGVEDTTALVLRLVAAGAGGVTELLGGGLLALCGRVRDGGEMVWKSGSLPGWMADAALSPSPEADSPALSRVDFCESGVTTMMLVTVCGVWVRVTMLTLLLGLLAESLAS